MFSWLFCAEGSTGIAHEQALTGLIREISGDFAESANSWRELFYHSLHQSGYTVFRQRTSLQEQAAELDML